MKALNHFSALIALSLVMSCAKTATDDNMDLTDTVKTKKTDFTQFGDSLTETLTVNLTQKTPSVKTAKNTQITIPNNAFQNKKGEIAVGYITLIVRELHKPSEMLLADKPAMTTEGGILKSYGEYYISAFQNNEPLHLRENIALTLTTPINNKDNSGNIPLWETDSTRKKAYSGLNQNADRITVEQAITKISGATWHTNGEKATINDQNLMTFQITKLNTWVNCDMLKPLETDNLTTVLVYFNQNYHPSVSTDLFEQQPSAVFFKPDGFNGLIKFYNPILTNEPSKQGFHSYENAIPVGMKGKLLAFTTTNGRYFISLQTVIMPEPALGKRFVSFTMQPIEVSKAQFLETIRWLDE